jgi:hypothetical protein
MSLGHIKSPPVPLYFMQSKHKTLAHYPTHRCTAVKLPTPNQLLIDHLRAPLPSFGRFMTPSSNWSKLPPPMLVEAKAPMSRAHSDVVLSTMTQPGEIPAPLQSRRSRPYQILPFVAMCLPSPARSPMAPSLAGVLPPAAAKASPGHQS